MLHVCSFEMIALKTPGFAFAGQPKGLSLRELSNVNRAILAVYCCHHVIGIALACGYIGREDFVDSR